MKAIKFKRGTSLKGGRVYREGEIAGFSEDIADSLIKRGVATAVAKKAKKRTKPAIEIEEK